MTAAFLISNAILGAAVLAFCVLIVRTILRRSPASIRHLVLAAGFAATLALPFGASLLQSAPSVLRVRSMVVLFVTPEGAGSMNAHALPGSPFPIETFTIAVWAAGAALLLLRLLAGLLHRSRSNRPADYAAPLAAELARDFGIGRRVRTEESSRVCVPETRGFFRPLIELPPAARDWSDERLRLVLTHELIHVVRHDWFWGVLAGTVTALHWFNPVAWYALRRLRTERELSCDDMVLSLGTDGCDYAGHLVEIAAGLGCAVEAGTVAMAHVSNLEARVRSILNSDLKRGGVTMKSKLAAATLAVAAVGLLSGLQAPAQSGSAALFGTVQDPSGAYIADCVVLVRNTANNKRELTRTDPSGEFRFAALPAGSYRLEVSKPGFRLFLQDGLVLQSGSAQQVSASLQVGSISESMTVAGTGPSAPKAKAQTPSRIRIGGSVQAAKLVNQVRPIYPQQMKDQGIQGSVLLDAVIGVDGRIVNVEPVNSLVHPDLVQSAIDAVRQWEYEPTYLNGNPIEVQTSITINYTLAP